MTIYGKNLSLFHQNQESFEAESWFIASGTQGLQIFFPDDDPRLTFDLVMASQICIPTQIMKNHYLKMY